MVPEQRTLVAGPARVQRTKDNTNDPSGSLNAGASSYKEPPVAGPARVQRTKDKTNDPSGLLNAGASSYKESPSSTGFVSLFVACLGYAEAADDAGVAFGRSIAIAVSPDKQSAYISGSTDGQLYRISASALELQAVELAEWVHPHSRSVAWWTCSLPIPVSTCSRLPINHQACASGQPITWPTSQR